MSEFLEDMIDMGLKALAVEGRRVLGAEATRVLESLVDAIRRLVIVQYIVMTACFLWAASFLMSGILVAAHWDLVRGRDFPPELIVTLSTWVISSLVLAISVQRSLWMRALGAARKAAQVPVGPPPPLSEAQVAAIVERTLREQMGQVIGEEIRSALRERPASQASSQVNDA